MDTLIMKIKEKFKLMNDGEISPSAYDTAWIARIPSLDNPKKPQYPMTLKWILENQNKDGSWGEPSSFLLYDRLVCTLACVLALKKWEAGEEQVAKGLHFLRLCVLDLDKETAILRTAGFEFIFPSMLNEAKNIGLALPYDLPCIEKILSLREKKIKRHAIHTTLLYSLEALQDVVQWDKILKLQCGNGSFLNSPSATAAAYMMTGDTKCLEFLTFIVNHFDDHAPCVYPIDIFDRIWMVDTIHRLGIDRHFGEEISDVLDYVYRNNGKRGVSWGRDITLPDIDDTCMALRLMRMHGYPISPDVLELFKDDNGNFICFPGETHQGVSDMFNLCRLSQISFPGRGILREARAFAEDYLKSCVQYNLLEDKWSLKKSLKEEINHAMQNPWIKSLQRLDVKEYIKHYGENDVWMGKTVYRVSNVNNPIYMELAKLDYNMLQSMYHKEMNFILRWWKICDFDESLVSSVLPEKVYYAIAAAVYEPEYAACRSAYAKINCIENILRDLFERHEYLHELRLFCQAVEQWNQSLACSLPFKLKGLFMAMHDTLNDLAIQASNAQGRDVFPYLHDMRVKQAEAYMRNRELREDDKLMESMSFEEYIEHKKEVSGVGMRVVPAMLLMGKQLQDHTLKCLDSRSKFHDKMALFLSLLDDVTKHQNKKNDDEETMTRRRVGLAVEYYMKGKKCNEAEAVGNIEEMMREMVEELVHEYLKPSRVPRRFRRLMFEHLKIANFNGFITETCSAATTANQMLTTAMETPV
ncbi:Neoabietadiene synthase protein [Dioscorea alata]|uniref:Neoabietadiene synthase protein n=1 Tax=Dioscorea alata TaxID=55571 RepID=A0ACB7TVP9_DIOAL|nr:Neoabietadiene synthase protein [Dioscorea alata]